jgi:hypothetical protein
MRVLKEVFWASCLIASISFLSWNHPVYAAETKKVCVDVKDKAGKVVKDAKGTPKQSCKEVKVHKKLEGEKLPEKKK